jgi:hypothetical protein
VALAGRSNSFFMPDGLTSRAADHRRFSFAA